MSGQIRPARWRAARVSVMSKKHWFTTGAEAFLKLPTSADELRNPITQSASILKNMDLSAKASLTRHTQFIALIKNTAALAV